MSFAFFLVALCFSSLFRADAPRSSLIPSSSLCFASSAPPPGRGFSVCVPFNWSASVPAFGGRTAYYRMRCVCVPLFKDTRFSPSVFTLSIYLRRGNYYLITHTDGLRRFLFVLVHLTTVRTFTILTKICNYFR